MRKTKDHEYEIVTCCGDPVKKVTLRIPVDDDPVLHEHKAMEKAGTKNYICGSCYDNAYRVKH